MTDGNESPTMVLDETPDYYHELSDYLDELEYDLWLQHGPPSIQTQEGEDAGGLKWDIPIQLPDDLAGIIGEGGASLKVSGMRKITLAGESRWTEGDITPNQSKFPSLDMKQDSRFTISGNIGVHNHEPFSSSGQACRSFPRKSHII